MNVNAIAVLAAWWKCPKCGHEHLTPLTDVNAKCRKCSETIRVVRITYANGAMIERETDDQTRNAKS